MFVSLSGVGAIRTTGCGIKHANINLVVMHYECPSRSFFCGIDDALRTQKTSFVELKMLFGSPCTILLRGAIIARATFLLPLGRAFRRRKESQTKKCDISIDGAFLAVSGRKENRLGRLIITGPSPTGQTLKDKKGLKIYRGFVVAPLQISLLNRQRRRVYNYFLSL